MALAPNHRLNQGELEALIILIGRAKDHVIELDVTDATMHYVLDAEKKINLQLDLLLLK